MRRHSSRTNWQAPVILGLFIAALVFFSRDVKAPIQNTVEKPISVTLKKHP